MGGICRHKNYCFDIISRTVSSKMSCQMNRKCRRRTSSRDHKNLIFSDETPTRKRGLIENYPNRRFKNWVRGSNGLLRWSFTDVYWTFPLLWESVVVLTPQLFELLKTESSLWVIWYLLRNVVFVLIVINTGLRFYYKIYYNLKRKR